MAFVVLSYLALNVAYTFYLKHIVIADIFSISAGFVLRVQAGALALSVELSSWMFASTFFPCPLLGLHQKATRVGL